MKDHKNGFSIKKKVYLHNISNCCINNINNNY